MRSDISAQAKPQRPECGGSLPASRRCKAQECRRQRAARPIKRGELEASKLGDAPRSPVIVTRAALERYIESKRIKPQTTPSEKGGNMTPARKADAAMGTRRREHRAQNNDVGDRSAGAADRQWVVLIDDGRRHAAVWNRIRDLAECERQATALRRHEFHATVSEVT